MPGRGVRCARGTGGPDRGADCPLCSRRWRCWAPNWCSPPPPRPRPPGSAHRTRSGPVRAWWVRSTRRPATVRTGVPTSTTATRAWCGTSTSATMARSPSARACPTRSPRSTPGRATSCSTSARTSWARRTRCTTPCSRAGCSPRSTTPCSRAPRPSTTTSTPSCSAWPPWSSPSCCSATSGAATCPRWASGRCSRSAGCGSRRRRWHCCATTTTSTTPSCRPPRTSRRVSSTRPRTGSCGTCCPPTCTPR